MRVFLLTCIVFQFFIYSSVADDVVPEDRIYSDKIKSVLFYPLPDGSQGVPITSLGQSANLILEFDELTDQPDNYYFKIYHYNSDWKLSYLNANQYLNDFNEFRVTEREMSFKTRIPYFHYSIVLPFLKVSGNYLIKVYRNYNEDDVILTRQFIIYEPLTPVTALITRSVVPSDAFTKQQVNFKINYGRAIINNPYQDVKVVVRQNFKNYTAIQNLKPVYIIEYEKTLDYQFYNNENAFNGGNEFRYFDLRSILFNGIYIDHVIRNNNQADAWILPESSRERLAYSFYEDINGAFFPQLYETLNKTTEPDYVKVHFKLLCPKPAPGDVYVTGRFNNWKALPEYMMTYDDVEKCYTGAFFLKQGYYNYAYSVVNAGQRDDLYFEGNSSYTENAYDIIVYARLQGDMCDRVIGYFTQRFKGR